MQRYFKGLVTHHNGGPEMGHNSLEFDVEDEDCVILGESEANFCVVEIVSWWYFNINN